MNVYVIYMKYTKHIKSFYNSEFLKSLDNSKTDLFFQTLFQKH